MVDIHAHALPFVDDGSDSFETSFIMIEGSISQGVTDIVLTPHYSLGEYETPATEIREEFEKFKAKVKERGLDINLYLGQEIFVRRDFKKIFESGNYLTMNGTKKVLIEFDTRNDFDIAEAVYDLKMMGLEPIVAHFERYTYADISVAEEIKSLGGYIQINAESLVGKTKHTYYKKVKALLKEGLVDFVASDMHDFRQNLIAKAYDFTARKFGAHTAEKLFNENAKQIIKG